MASIDRAAKNRAGQSRAAQSGIAEIAVIADTSLKRSGVRT
jgi:hypothetical protein